MGGTSEEAVGRFWHYRSLRLVGWVAAYVLALQTMLFGFGTVPSSAWLASTASGFQLCLTGADGGDPDLPLRHQAVKHCPGCFVGLTGFAHPPRALEPVSFPVLVPRLAAAANQPLKRQDSGRPGLPRAPPSLA
jgi:hypothetical protein